MAKWFQTVPTEAGLYFARIPDSTTEILIEATEILLEDTPTLCFFLAEHEVDPTAFVWWYGPIGKDS